MAVVGWHKLIPDGPCFLGEGNFRIDAYSEYQGPPRIGWKPYGTQGADSVLFSEDDPFGWHVGEFEETLQLQPGLVQIGQQLLHKIERLTDGNLGTTLPSADLENNIYWPPELAAEPKLPHEKHILLMPLALSLSQDDKGRVRWTLFGASEQGPSKGFWKSFFTGPKAEMPAEQGIAFFCNLLSTVYGEHIEGSKALMAAGFRIMTDPSPVCEHWKETLPSWAEPFTIGDRASPAKVKYLLTFRPFGKLPMAFRKAYLEGKLHLLPFPGSLVFWGAPHYGLLEKELPFARQIPLILNVARHRIPCGIRVPQSGFMHEPSAEHPHAHSHAGHVRNTYKRTHRWDKILRDEDELALIGKEDKMLHVLFSSVPEDVDLYDKPMARNVQLWQEDGKLLLDGPKAKPEQIKIAMRTVQSGGIFGYRFMFPAMQVGKHEVYWHRPLVAYRDKERKYIPISNAPLGYLTAYDAAKPRLDKTIELWPRLLHRPLAAAALALHDAHNGHAVNPIILNVRKLLDASHKFGGKPLSRSFAQSLLTLHPGQTVEKWLETVPQETIAPEVARLIEPMTTPLPRAKNAKIPDSLTYAKTAKRAFEVAYWKAISSLSEGTFLNKNNADCVLDETTKKMLPYHERQLDFLGDCLLEYYGKKIAAAGLKGKAIAGEIPFQWRTDFDYSWMGGWLKNREEAAERDLLIVIPGKNRNRAVIMADHYDTAYMADRFYKELGGNGARMAACGADDNHSATAAMMLAAPIFLEMSKRGLLACDIWLVHLTGEEFPADCLGARALSQRLVERSLTMRLPDGKTKDLSHVEIHGLYVSDMIAHNNDHARDIYQISPGTDPHSMWLALQAQIAGEIWNESVSEWNKDPERTGRPRGRRSPHGGAIPEIAPFLSLTGQVRPAFDPRSTLFNTDGQVFSDAGIPCVLFMENYDINRTGYHDTHDTMENIDLDYGSAFCAITIEAVARAACR